jgi:thiamine kinase-like enzyme
MDEYLAIAGAAGASVAAVWNRWRPSVDPVLSRIEGRLVPSHVDPVPDNILILPQGDRLVAEFVDWEYSAPAAPVWDLADFAVEARLERAEQAALLAAYAAATESAVAAAFELYKPMLDLLAAAWAASQTRLPGRRTEHDALIEARLARALDVLERPDFGRTLAEAGRFGT